MLLNTILRTARARPVRARLLSADLPTLPRPARGGAPDPRPSHRLPPPPYRPRVGPRTSLQLSPCLRETTLVLVPTGAPPGQVPPRPLRPRRPRLPGGRRYGRRAARYQGPWPVL